MNASKALQAGLKLNILIYSPPVHRQFLIQRLVKMSCKFMICQAIKTGKPTLEPLETDHRTISMSQLGLISVKIGAKLTWNTETEKMVGDNTAEALLNIPIR